MPQIKEKLKTFLNVFLNHTKCVSNVIFIAVAAGFEQAWEHVTFKCPDNTSTKLYSIVFVLAPAVALWILGILGSNIAWRLCQGMYYRTQSHDCSCFYPCCWHLSIISLRAAVIPLTWVFVALMDGDFYACFFYRPECPKGSTSDFINDIACTKNITVWNRDSKVDSQMIGAIYLTVCLLLALMVVFCSRYYSRRPYFPHLYSNKLKKTERLQIEKLLQVQVEKDTKENVGALMMKFSTLPAKDWLSICREYAAKENEKADTNKENPYLHHSALSEFMSNNLKVLEAFKLAEKQKAQLDAQHNKPKSEKPETQKPETETQKPEIQTQKPEIQTQKPEIQTQKPESPKPNSLKPKPKSLKPKTEKPETQTQMPETPKPQPENSNNQL